MPFGSEGVQDGVGLALSGGGFRATLFHTGTLWRLNELGWLSRLDRVSSVSGGSIVAAVLAKAWAGFSFEGGVATNFKETVVPTILEFTTRNVDKPSILKGLLTPGKSIAQYVADQYRKHLSGDFGLEDLPDRPRFVFNATNLGTGANWRFSKPYSGDYRIGLVRNLELPVATAVAASAAFPPVLSPVVLKLDPGAFEKTDGADLYETADLRRVVSLADGGVYDNMGLESVWKRYRTLLISDAGGPASMEFGPKPFWWNQLHRAYNLTIEQDRDLRRRIVVGDFKAKERHGSYWHISWPIEKFEVERRFSVDPYWVARLAGMRTRLDRFSEEEQKRLVNWGYALTDASVRRWVEPSDRGPMWPYPEFALGRP